MMEWESTSGIFFGVRFGDGGISFGEARERISVET